MSWPSRFGTLGERVFGKDDPFNDRELSAISNFSSDEIKPTKSPITGKIYTSKAALRAEYKAHGAEEVGTAFEKGYDPQKSLDAERTRRNDEKAGELFRHNLSLSGASLRDVMNSSKGLAERLQQSGRDTYNGKR